MVRVPEKLGTTALDAKIGFVVNNNEHWCHPCHCDNFVLSQLVIFQLVFQLVFVQIDKVF